MSRECHNSSLVIWHGLNKCLFLILLFTDINECTFNPCAENAVCRNTEGSYVCRCKEGFVGDGLSCLGKCTYKIQFVLTYNYYLIISMGFYIILHKYFFLFCSIIGLYEHRRYHLLHKFKKYYNMSNFWNFIIVFICGRLHSWH